jgi:hypothetical protein
VIEDPGQWRCGYSNLGKILRKFVDAKRGAATFVAARPCRKIPVSRYPPIKLERKVALCAANKIGRPFPEEMLSA